jgi:hypothetical protein
MPPDDPRLIGEAPARANTQGRMRVDFMVTGDLQQKKRMGGYGKQWDHGRLRETREKYASCRPPRYKEKQRSMASFELGRASLGAESSSCTLTSFPPLSSGSSRSRAAGAKRIRGHVCQSQLLRESGATVGRGDGLFVPLQGTQVREFVSESSDHRWRLPGNTPYRSTRPPFGSASFRS